MIDIPGAYTLNGKTHRGLASQVAKNTRDIAYLMENGLLPEGTLDISENGTYDVRQYVSVDVDVQGTGPAPSGNIDITRNGNFDVTNYAVARVNVPPSIVDFDQVSVTINKVGSPIASIITRKPYPYEQGSPAYIGWEQRELTDKVSLCNFMENIPYVGIHLNDGFYISSVSPLTFSNMTNCTKVYEQGPFYNDALMYLYYIVVTDPRNVSLTITEA